MAFKTTRIKNARQPNLDTIIMIENCVIRHSALSRREIWLKLPKKVMWQTFLVALDYLVEIGRVKFEMGRVEWNVKNEKVNNSIRLDEVPSYVY